MSSPITSQLLEQGITAEPWTNDAVLYQPYEVEQILLAENASCLSVKTFLKMCQLEFTVEPCANAEHMSPGGHMTKLPVLQSGAFVVSELEPIIYLVEKKGVSLTHFLDADEKNDLRAYLCLTEKIFTCAELYVSWIDSKTLNETTYKRYGSVYPWPLNRLQSWRKRRHVVNKLTLFGWAKYTNEQVLRKVEKCCITLTEKLGKNHYFYGDSPTELDALVFGHIYTILTTPLPNSDLQQLIKNKFETLIQFCLRIEKTFYGGK